MYKREGITLKTLYSERKLYFVSFHRHKSGTTIMLKCKQHNFSLPLRNTKYIKNRSFEWY